MSDPETMEESGHSSDYETDIDYAANAPDDPPREGGTKRKESVFVIVKDLTLPTSADPPPPPRFNSTFATKDFFFFASQFMLLKDLFYFLKLTGQIQSPATPSSPTFDLGKIS